MADSTYRSSEEVADDSIYRSSEEVVDDSISQPSDEVDNNSIMYQRTSDEADDQTTDSINVGSLCLSSDEFHDLYCDPCHKADRSKEASGFCRTCGEFYCTFCLGVHRRSSLTASHKILTGADLPSDPVTAPVRGEIRKTFRLEGQEKNNIKMPNDIEVCAIRGIDARQNGTVILADKNNKKIKMLSRDGHLISALELPSLPFGVVFVNEFEAVISMDESIGFMDIRNGSKMALKYTVSLGRSVADIVAYGDNFIITSWDSVSMIDRRGKTLWIADADTTGKSLFENARFLTVCHDTSTVIVTDWKTHTITVFDSQSGKLLKACDVIGKGPSGITVDETGNVFVCYNSGEISVWDADMTGEDCLLSRTFRYPNAMAYSQSRKELLLSTGSNNPNLANFIYRYPVDRTA